MSHPLNPRQQPVSPRTLQGVRPDAGVASLRLQDGIYRENQQRRGDRDIVRATVRSAEPFPVQSVALVKNLAPGSNFKNVTGALIYDSGTLEETRLYIRMGGIGNGSAIITAALDGLLITGGALGAAGTATLVIAPVFADFNPDTLTWSNQPDNSDPTQVSASFTQLIDGLIGDRATLQGYVTSTNLFAAKNVSFGFGAQATGAVIKFKPITSGVVCRAVVNLISNLSFYPLTGTI